MVLKLHTDKRGELTCELCGLASTALAEVQSGKSSIKLCAWCVGEMHGALNSAINNLHAQKIREEQASWKPKC